MRGKSTRALGVPEHYRKLWLEAYRTSLRSGESVGFDYYHEPKGWLKVTVDYIGTEDGEARFSYVADDITERKRSEQAVLEARDLLELRVKARTTELERAKADLLQANAQLQHDAFHDALTGLPNRALFADRLGRSLERVKPHPEIGFVVLFLDLDHFKVVNDSLGHEVGDQLLVAVRARLVGLCPRDRHPGTFGGRRVHAAARGLHLGTRYRSDRGGCKRLWLRPFELRGARAVRVGECRCGTFTPRLHPP